MYHRYMWEREHGPIPEGYEINHLCKNRACFNIDHLECINGTDHTVLTNTERYAERKEEAKQKWLTGHWSATQIASHFDVSWSSAFRWIREWKRQ